MIKRSAGILMYHFNKDIIEVLLVHPGGPFWAKKDLGAWSIPKGEFDEGEDPLETAKREFSEETGFKVEGNMTALTPIKQPHGKIVYVWIMEGDCDAGAIKSNTFTIEWPPHSGKQEEFPEIDRGAWFTLPVAQEKILPGQSGFIKQLVEILGVENPFMANIDTRSNEESKTKTDRPIQKSLFEL